MRLGSYPCKVAPDTKLHQLYGQSLINELHRHRYEVNTHYKDQFVKKGLVFAGMSPDGSLVEAIEIPESEFFLAVQFHPEFKSRPINPHPLFVGFLESAKNRKVVNDASNLS